MCHLVGISYHYKIVFMFSTTLCRAVSRARTWFAAVYRWVILPSGISSDCKCPLDVAGRKLCVKWKMNILVTFCINFATRSASRHNLFQVWNVRNICQQSQRTRACRTSRHKLAHCEGLATFGNSQFWPSGIVVACVCLCVCPYVCVNPLLVRAITHHPFKLGSPNLDHRCKRPWLRSLLFWGVIDLDLQLQI